MLAPNILSISNYRDIDFLEGAIILIDKPLGWTSFDVVNKLRSKLRYTLNVKKIKVGHAGTLDPLATGLLIICTGKLTKSIDSFQSQNKVYSGHFVLGSTTATYDSEIPPDSFFSTAHIDQALLESARQSFLGEISQIPPIYSAIKINGSKAYQLARRGVEGVEMKARSINIVSFSILNDNLSKLEFLLHCSKGTYVRSLAFDFGRACRSGAYLGALRREKIGDFTVIDALSIEQACELIETFQTEK